MRHHRQSHRRFKNSFGMRSISHRLTRVYMKGKQPFALQGNPKRNDFSPIKSSLAVDRRVTSARLKTMLTNHYKQSSEVIF